MSAWAASLELLEPLAEEEWVEYTETVKEFYRHTYRMYVFTGGVSAAGTMETTSKQKYRILGPVPYRTLLRVITCYVGVDTGGVWAAGKMQISL